MVILSMNLNLLEIDMFVFYQDISFSLVQVLQNLVGSWNIRYFQLNIVGDCFLAKKESIL